MKLTAQLSLRLRFSKISSADFATIARHMALTDSRTCDYTLGGVVLWADYFDYRIATADDTLFILGRREDDLSVPAFALPLGGPDFGAAMDRIGDYCGRAGIEPCFSAVPEDRLHLFASTPTLAIRELGPQWSDYLYAIGSMASLNGRALKKKRNHVNRLLADNPSARLVPLGAANIAACMELLGRCGNDGTPTGIAEFRAVGAMLSAWSDYEPFFTGMVLDIGGRPAAFTVGEVKGDTFHVHVEKSDHTISGANEAVTSMFAAEMLRRHPRLLYVNRQDDAGNEGIRASKLSWHPLRLLPKFNVTLRTE